MQYTPMKGSNNFVQSVVKARGDEERNLISGDVAELMKTLANSSYDF